MVLCTFCKNITIDRIAVDGKAPSQRWEEPQGYDHQSSYPALLGSAKTCELCCLISEVAQQNGSLPKFDPKFDVIPDQIVGRNASQRLKLRAFRQFVGGSSSTVTCRQLGGVHVSNAQGVNIYLEMFADGGQFNGPQAVLT
jgi:hypothetical protein